METILISTHFSKQEATCNCGCGRANIDKELLLRLEYARLQAKTPFVIKSWNRCIEHNTKIGGKGNSAHLKGYAVDIQTITKEKQRYVLFYLLVAGFTRIGIGDMFIHVDCDPDKQPEKIWFY